MSNISTFAKAMEDKSLCQNLKASYERLMELTKAFIPQYEAAKASGDFKPIKHLKKELEAAKEALYKQLLIFQVKEASNPYREALLLAGIKEGEAIEEKKEMTVDILGEIKRQSAIYADVRDEEGKPILQSWVDDIETNHDLMASEVAKDHDKIIERINVGMVPIIMPSREVQEKTWELALLKLKPLWIEEGESKVVNDAYLYDEYRKKMTQNGFFCRRKVGIPISPSAVGEHRENHIPDRPYIVWIKPTQEPDAETCNKNFKGQKALYAKLVRENPSLYDPTDIIPTEYLSLQATFTRAVRDAFKKEQGEDTQPTTIKPLDEYYYTRLLSAGAFSGGGVPYADFDPGFGYRHLGFGYDSPDPGGKGGFRPAGRT